MAPGSSALITLGFGAKETFLGSAGGAVLGTGTAAGAGLGSAGGAALTTAGAVLGTAGCDDFFSLIAILFNHTSNSHSSSMVAHGEPGFPLWPF